jgi:diguanylate cyclase (GGDEF)-like protein/PAS domain S-box-containing protein
MYPPVVSFLLVTPGGHDLPLPALIEPWSGWLLAAVAVLLGYQQLRLYRLRQRLARREELFRIVAENAADMIALVDVKGRRLYNSPAYEKVLGYSPEELAKTSAFEQVHPEDRLKVLDAAREARRTGIGTKLEYRIRHKNGSWRILESSASTIKNAQGDVEKLVIVNRDITERKLAEEALEHNSFHDALTDLPNRRLFLDRLERSFARARRNPDYQYAVLFVDVDGFKAFNETMGNLAGDHMIREIGHRLATCLRSDDTVARPKGKLPIEDLLSHMGGDEFTILLEGIHDPSDALRVAKRTQAVIAAPLAIGNRELLTSVSIGIAVSTPSRERPEDLLQDADTAMRRAKSLGGSRCEVFDEVMHRRAVRRLTLEAELHTALEGGQFQLCYQPIVNLQTRLITGFEALLRWQRAEHNLVSPYEFIEVAENIGLLVSIGKWVLREACRQLSAWHDQHPDVGLNMTVNVSPRQLAHAGFIADLKSSIQESGIEPSRLRLEVAESAAMADPQLAFEVLTQARLAGVAVSLGDLGAGRSSLAWLCRWPLQEVKVDRALVGSILSERANSDIVRLIVTLARSLKLQVVATGIENAAHLELLHKLGCEFGQGSLFSQPLDAHQAEEFFRRHSAQARGKSAGSE